MCGTSLFSFYVRKKWCRLDEQMWIFTPASAPIVKDEFSGKKHGFASEQLVALTLVTNRKNLHTSCFVNRIDAIVPSFREGTSVYVHLFLVFGAGAQIRQVWQLVICTFKTASTASNKRLRLQEQQSKAKSWIALSVSDVCCVYRTMSFSCCFKNSHRVTYFVAKGTVSRDGFCFRWLVWLVLVLNL